MNPKYLHEYMQTYNYYKRQNLSAVILFHINDVYCAFGEDGVIVANIDGQKIMQSNSGKNCWYSFNENKLADMMYKIAIEAEIPVITVEYRNKSGSFDVPKVKQIEQDFEDDY